MKELLMCCPNVLRLAASKSSYSGREDRRPRGARMPRKTARRRASDRLGRSGCSRAQTSSPATKSGGSRKAGRRSPALPLDSGITFIHARLYIGQYR